MSKKQNGASKLPGRAWGRGLLAVAIVAVAVGAYVLRPAAGQGQASPASTAAPVKGAGDAPARAATTASLPRLIDLGADKCVPCKMMAPVLDQLRVDYAGKLRVDFIDVWKSPQAGEPFNIKLIPTQVFQSPDGTELFRHEGFFSREDILAKWRELGYAL